MKYILAQILLVFCGLASSLVSFTDPGWNDSWHLHQESPGMRIQEAWGLGLSGNGVRVLILDTGIDRYHPDLFLNYQPRLSYDFVSNKSDPHLPLKDNPHGTNMAGLIGAQGNNSVCGVGVAFGVEIGMGRILDKESDTTVSEVLSRALAFRKEEIDVIVMAFGPNNGGVNIGGLTEDEAKALRDSEMGRGGKGNILMLSTGNSGALGDICSFNAFSQSIHTISINAVGRKGDIPHYAELCTSVLASAFGSNYEDRLLTTSLNGACVENFSGTSSSNAVATGVLALALEANPSLTWRDAQHLLIRSVAPISSLDPGATWNTNAAGLKYSPAFGFGLIDAYALVTNAKNWTTVPEQRKCELKVSSRALISGEHVLQQVGKMEGCSISYLEHVQVELTAYSLCRGNVNLNLRSPSGTSSKILSGRHLDFANTGFNGWPLLSLEFWGEPAEGEWELNVFRSPCVLASRIALESWTLILYGYK